MTLFAKEVSSGRPTGDRKEWYSDRGRGCRRRVASTTPLIDILRRLSSTHHATGTLNVSQDTYRRRYHIIHYTNEY